MSTNEFEQRSPLALQALWLREYRPGLRIAERGNVLSVGDGIARVTGLSSAAMEDILEFEDGSSAMVFDLTKDQVGAVLLHETDILTAGTPAHLNVRPLNIPVGDGLLGRILNPLGIPLDGEAPPIVSAWQPLNSPSPPIVSRDFVHSPLYSGNKIIDTMVPIGKGQRQLLIGDEGLGRSTIALDTLINQRSKNVRCVYVLIGQRRSTVVNTIEILREYDALEYTTVVVAEASNLPGLQHLAPFSGCAIAEYWMQQGHDTLVVYDDLSTHAKIYRELSLLLRRPPGREAYPGDIFSVHARLLERTTCLSPAHGGGSMTALPIVETQQGEIASYIPTNLISITDGQIYLDRDLFSGGFRPAIDIARSVSRVGGQAQHPRIKEEAGSMKLNYLQFLELESFTRFGARLEASIEAAIKRGLTLREILKQEQYSPFHEFFQMAWLVAFNDGHFDNVEKKDIHLLLDTLEEQVEHTSLTLDSPREQWSSAIADWLSSRATEEDSS
ncbi:F0F1 ATP synthase subunit alpha [Halodesulfovibrio marinisediminis]|uniref:ATP synthase subunit alpha n=1 Tax=Halodesulfovibrio marinisediminis DSM 17456 TaxID=1121457 RepID=A0A1N6GVV8_9BACT|nr:F0F1 ATP synthase subunit alpha [Halodesulfovibrio marinisediminis]SIO11721.1 F-type H+-transporting ATPase subunit alpha [Halodesulfovibrio marinisediminis DSM 17456]